ncbi:hypothetical protein HFD91_02215 [Enterobacteriaceae bacterium EKM102V]|uniref:hypothetical protein n=1 Tax=Pantoea TaxID=53335 RepID=UPI00142D896D|nr:MULTISPECIES: hypothetical protein [Pantoea]KAF6662402.1 hypothetical protein HFD91_02215 [Enterobacteriaceae bacterium EKM102V]KAF6670868.1 hypothetical protein HFD97_02220 [Pantoea sp. EKM103V]
MCACKIYFVSKPSPTIGRSPLHGIGAGLFGYYNDVNYINEVKRKIESNGYNWDIIADDTDGDIEEIIKKGVMLIVCAPGLRFQFYINGFDKKRVIYLNTFDYACKNVTTVLSKIKELDNEK